MITRDQLTVTERIFFQTLPVFVDEANAPYTFAAMEPYLAQALGRMYPVVEPARDLSPDEERQTIYYAQATMCYMAAFTALPQLDLVYTPNGFGVVSNQNVAPASRERVEALRRSLEQGRDEFFTRLVEHLRNQSKAWCASEEARRIYSSLISLPADASGAGIYDERTHQSPTTFTELSLFRARISEAETVMANFISFELLEELTRRQLTPHAERYTPDCTPYTILITRARAFIATYVVRPADPALPRMGARLAAFAQEKQLKEYISSSHYRAARSEGYTNRKDDSVYFFN